MRVYIPYAPGGHNASGSDRKKRTNITLMEEKLAAARELELNVSAISDAAVAEVVKVAKTKAWNQENAAAIEERRTWIVANGTPLTDLQVLKID